jgi:very-short-patch-repair endonuclease
VVVKLEALDSFAARHHGLVTRAAAERVGISRSSWYRAIQSGAFEPLHPNVARVWGSPITRAQHILAAVFAAGPGTLASHRSSAWLWTVDRPTEDPVDVILGARARHALPDGIVVHRPTDRYDLRPVMRQNVPTTNPMRMLLDLGAVDPPAVFDAMIAVMSAKFVSPTAIRAALQRHARRGRHGTVALRTALERWADEELPPDSDLEAAMVTLAAAHGLPPVQFHAIVEGFEVDFLVVDTKVIIECDGWATHGLDRDQFEFDRVRDAVLTAAGYLMVHTTWRQITSTPHAAAARIRAVVEQWHRSSR